MTWLKHFASRFSALFRKRHIEQDMNDELRSHLDMLIEENVRRGMSRENARYAALQSFGGVEQVKENYRDQRGLPIMETLLQDIRFGLRQLRRNPGFTIVAVLTLALGIGANTAIFSVVNAVVLRPLPYPHSRRLVWITEVIPELNAELVPGGDYVDWRDQNKTLERITAYDPAVSLNLTGRGTPARIHAASVSANFFQTLGVDPQLGRSFTHEEDQPNGPHTVVLMQAFWQQYFGSNPQVLGKTVTLNSAPYTVVGVMPASFRFPGDAEIQMLVPLQLNETGERMREGAPGPRFVRIIGLMKPDVTIARAQVDLDAIRKRAEASQMNDGGPDSASGPKPDSTPRAGSRQVKRLNGPSDTQLKVVFLEEQLAGNLRPAMLTLLGAVGLVLLIACANVANLMLTRSSARTREVAVRAVLGAGHWRLVRQLLSESLILALAGGVAGLMFAAWGVRVMTRLMPASLGASILNVAPVRLDAQVLLFTLAVSAITGILFGLAPALAATRLKLSEKLKEGSPGTGARSVSLRGALAMAELSLALILLIGAGLLIKSFYRFLSVDPGFITEHILTMNLSLTDSRYPKALQKRAFYLEVLRRVESLPGVRSAAFVDSLPLSPYLDKLFIVVSLAPESRAASNKGMTMSGLTVSPAYFSTLGIRVLKGRTFTDADDDQAPKVAVINEALARHIWPGENPLGKKLPGILDKRTVVGVVADTRHEGLSADVESEIYFPLFQQTRILAMQLAVRTAADPVSMISAVRTQIAAIDPEEPIYNVTTLDQTLSDSVAPRRFNMLMLGIFAGIALALATVGIYGVMAFSVTQRTREIGIRMALGAHRRDVLGLVARQALGVTLAGVAFGLVGAWALTRFIASFLYGVQATDPATFVVVPLALVTVSLLACYIPARRATKVDPMVALRYE
ncbi:MAG: ADOP family duplicated permease [Terriglobia bacterium]